MLVIRVRQPIIDLIAQIVTKKHFHCSHFGKILTSVIVRIILAELLFEFSGKKPKCSSLRMVDHRNAARLNKPQVYM